MEAGIALVTAAWVVVAPEVAVLLEEVPEALADRAHGPAVVEALPACRVVAVAVADLAAEEEAAVVAVVVVAAVVAAVAAGGNEL